MPIWPHRRIGRSRKPHRDSYWCACCCKAGASEILVSSAMKDMVSESGIRFKDRGVHNLRGVPDRWRLYLVDSCSSTTSLEPSQHASNAQNCDLLPVADGAGAQSYLRLQDIHRVLRPHLLNGVHDHADDYNRHDNDEAGGNAPDLFWSVASIQSSAGIAPAGASWPLCSLVSPSGPRNK